MTVSGRAEGLCRGYRRLAGSARCGFRRQTGHLNAASGGRWMRKEAAPVRVKLRNRCGTDCPGCRERNGIPLHTRARGAEGAKGRSGAFSGCTADFCRTTAVYNGGTACRNHCRHPAFWSAPEPEARSRPGTAPGAVCARTTVKPQQ